MGSEQLNQDIVEYMIYMEGVLFVKFGLNYLQQNVLVAVRYLEQNQSDQVIGKNI